MAFYKELAKLIWWSACGVGAVVVSGGLAYTVNHFNAWDIWMGLLVVTSMCSGIHTIAITMKIAKNGEA